MIDSDKKSILIISCVFPPEPVVSAKTSLSVANKLTELGHSVKVLSPFPSRTSGKLHKGYTRSLYKKDSSFDNFELVRCFSTLSSKPTILSRFMENISFGMFCFKAGVFLDELKKHSPEIHEACEKTLEKTTEENLIRIKHKNMVVVPEDSIDYAANEK